MAGIKNPSAPKIIMLILCRFSSIQWVNAVDYGGLLADVSKQSSKQACLWFETDPPVSSIRIYSRTPPPWLSAHDVVTMRALAGAKVLRVEQPQGAPWPLLVFESTRPEEPNAALGLALGPVDSVEVFAFHLDRVLGLNRTLPAVSRKLAFLHGGPLNNNYSKMA